jgi:hypothetical protein
MERIILQKGERSLARIVAFISALSKDKAWKVEIGEYKRTRSNDQNAYLWTVYEHILKTCDEQLRGWTKEELHEFFLGTHFGWETVEGFGRKRVRPLRRSSRLSTVEFSEFVAAIQQFMAERGIYLPDPGEVTNEDRR